MKINYYSEKNIRKICTLPETNLKQIFTRSNRRNFRTTDPDQAYQAQNDKQTEPPYIWTTGMAALTA